MAYKVLVTTIVGLTNISNDSHPSVDIKVIELDNRSDARNAIQNINEAKTQTYIQRAIPLYE